MQRLQIFPAVAPPPRFRHVQDVRCGHFTKLELELEVRFSGGQQYPLLSCGLVGFKRPWIADRGSPTKINIISCEASVIAMDKRTPASNVYLSLQYPLRPS